MEVPDAHWERLASYMFKDNSAAFSWDLAMRVDFVARKFSAITEVEFMKAFYVMYFPES